MKTFWCDRKIPQFKFLDKFYRLRRELMSVMNINLASLLESSPLCCSGADNVGFKVERILNINFTEDIIIPNNRTETIKNKNENGAPVQVFQP